MEYVFYYKEKSGMEHISCTCYDEENQKKTYEKIGNSEKMIEFINRHCTKLLEVYFVDFSENKMIYILNKLSDTLEINYPPIGYEGPYQMFKRQPKMRGK